MTRGMRRAFRADGKRRTRKTRPADTVLLDARLSSGERVACADSHHDDEPMFVTTADGRSGFVRGDTLTYDAP